MIVVVAILAVMVLVLAPKLLSYNERSRAEKDNSSMDEVVNAIQLALADQEVYDEVLNFSTVDNVSCYVDTNSEANYSKIVTKENPSGINQYTFTSDARTLDETPYFAAGNMRGVTITFAPDKGSNGSTFDLKQGVVNQYVQVSGNQRVGAMPKLYNRLRSSVGDVISNNSQTYRNSEFTIFIALGSTGGKDANAQDAIRTYGQWSGTNLPAQVSYQIVTDRTVGDTGNTIVDIDDNKWNQTNGNKITVNPGDLNGGGSYTPGTQTGNQTDDVPEPSDPEEPEEEIPDFSHLTTVEGCPLKFGQAYINTDTYMAIIPFADGGVLTGVVGWGWGNLEFMPAGSVEYDGCNVNFGGMTIATSNEDGTIVIFEGMPFKLESYEFGSNDFCSHYFYDSNYIEPYKSLGKIYEVGETDLYTGYIHCVYCSEMISGGNCKHKDFYFVNNMGIGNGDKICKYCDKVLEYGCIYYQYKYESIPSGASVDTSHMGGDYKKYTAKDGFPETIKPGDKFQFGDFEYCYGAYVYSNESSPMWGKASEDAEYWGVSIIDRNKQYYDGEILAEINGKEVKNMSNCFYMSKAIDLSKVTLPNTILYMSYAFAYCASLESAPTIPSSVQIAQNSFTGCENLTGNISINSNFQTSSLSYSNFFSGTKKPIRIIGTTTKKSQLAATANNGNVTY